MCVLGCVVTRDTGVFGGKVGLFPKIYVDDTTVKHKAGQVCIPSVSAGGLGVREMWCGVVWCGPDAT